MPTGAPNGSGSPSPGPCGRENGTPTADPGTRVAAKIAPKIQKTQTNTSEIQSKIYGKGTKVMRKVIQITTFAAKDDFAKSVVFTMKNNIF